MIWQNNPVSFLQALGILFIGLKLTGHVTWDWWWVLSPLWFRMVGIILFWLIIDSMMKKWKANKINILEEIAKEVEKTETRH